MLEKAYNAENGALRVILTAVQKSTVVEKCSVLREYLRVVHRTLADREVE